jgi:hypothetical protein
MKNRKIIFFFSLIFLIGIFSNAVSILADEENGYTKIYGIWVDVNFKESYATAIIFKADGTFEKYFYYDKDEVIKTVPASVLWSGSGSFEIGFDILVMKYKQTSDNILDFSESYHFVKFSPKEMILLNTIVSEGKRLTYTKIK